LRRRRCRQRRRQNDQHDHRGFAHHCHRIKPPHALASWPLIQSPVVTCERPLGVAQGPKTCRATRGGTQEQMRRDIPRWSGMADVRFGSKADILRCESDVRFAPNSGHLQRTSRCPLCANSGHRAPFRVRRKLL
jgi:hypothetical protein